MQSAFSEQYSNEFVEGWKGENPKKDSERILQRLTPEELRTLKKLEIDLKPLLR